MAIGAEDHKQLRVSIAQEDVDRFQSRVGSSIRARVRGRSYLLPDARLASLGPAASRLLEHPALGAHCGGPLAVTAVAEAPDDPQHAATAMQLVAPRLDAKVSIPAKVAADLRAGELATVTLGRTRGTIGANVYDLFSAWLRENIAQRE